MLSSQHRTEPVHTSQADPPWLSETVAYVKGRPRAFQAVAIDLDHTTLRSDRTASPLTIATMPRLEAAGLLVPLASGRPYESMLRVADTLGLRGLHIGLNGAIVLNRERGILHRTPVPSESIQRILRICEGSENLIWHAYDGPDWVVPKMNHFVEEEAQILGFQPNRFARCEDVSQAEKLLVNGPDQEILAFAEMLRNSEPGVSVVRPFPCYLDIMAAGVSKGTALLKYAEIMEIDIGNIMAIGDGDNDIEMVAAAGCGVAMGNSTAALKAAAQVQIGHADDDALAIFLDRLFLQV